MFSLLEKTGELRVALLLIHLLFTLRISTYAGGKAEELGQKGGAEAAGGAEGSAVKKAGAPSSQAKPVKSELDTRLCVFALVLLANLSVLSIYNEQIGGRLA